MLSLLRNFFAHRTTERAFYLAGAGDMLLVLTVLVGIVVLIRKVL